MIRVEFDTDNAAFAEPPDGAGFYSEIARILGVAAERIGRGGVVGPLHDLNGNSVGFFQVIPGQRVDSQPAEKGQT